MLYPAWTDPGAGARPLRQNTIAGVIGGAGALATELRRRALERRHSAF